MTLILAQKKRKLTRDLTMKDSDGVTVIAGADDVVRVKIGYTGKSPLLDLDSIAASTWGSTISKNTPSSGVNRVEVSQTDMNTLKPGVYVFEMSLVDGADSDAIKHVDHQIMVVQDTMTGDVGVL